MYFVLAIGALLAFVVLMLRRTQMPPQIRSVIAVLFGFFAVALTVSFCTMLSARTLHIKPGDTWPPAFYTLSALYSVLAALLGGWVTGDVAPEMKQFWHGVALAAVMVALSLPGVLHPAPGEPAWHRGFLLIVPPLSAIAGASLARRRMRI